ncbi:hypothetical protein QTP88_021239 [Uroleucon formosanum]
MSNPTYQKLHEEVGKQIEVISWESTEGAAKEEAQLAYDNGDISKDGIPMISVVADGAWSKRSYRSNYNALSGVAWIVGYRTKNVLFIGIRNKYCSTCQKAEALNKSTTPHLCYKNGTGTSTAMESDIIVDGFSHSIKTHNLIYRNLIGYGDSSVIKKLRMLKNYGSDLLVEKIECTNHILRNYLTRLRDFSTERKSTSGNTVLGFIRTKLKENLLRLRSDDKDEFETVAKETLDKIIEILEQDEINNTGSELIESVELDKLVEELDTFDEEIFNDKVGNKPISSDVLNKSLRLINLDEFENSPTTNVTRQGLRSNRNTIHTEYIQPKRTVKTKKMTGGSEMKPLNAIEAIKLIPDYSGQTEIYPFLNACEVIINTVDVDQQPFMLKMIAATKLSDRAFNATRYKEIKVWEDMKKILLDAFETPYAAANLQIELNIIKMRYDETVCAYNNRVEEIYQKLCNAVVIDKTPAEAKILRNNIREQALVSYINGLNDKLKFEVKTKNPTTLEQAMQIAIIAEKNIRTYNDVQEIFRTKNTSNTLTHKINIPENQEPIYKRPYRLPHAQMAEIDSQIKQMEKDDIIEPSFSPWNAPLLLVKKKLDASQIPKFRIVVDFRALNKVTINEYHPLPNITEILDQLGQCNLFSIIDLASGFYQIKLDEKSKELTAFSTNQGHWHFKKMAMGLKTSPCSFQRLMNNVMAGIVGIKCLVYLDDIIIYGKGLLDHNEKLRDVFERLRNHNLKIQPTKCEFLKQQCMYLGHIISENGILKKSNQYYNSQFLRV